VEESKRLAKNKQISLSKQETLKRHASMLCKSFTVKIQQNKLSKLQQQELKMIFVEAKWFKNDILNWSNNPENKIWKYNTKAKTISHKDKDMKDIKVSLKYLGSSMKQTILAEMISNIKTLHTLKSKGLQQCGKLKFVKEIKSIGLKQYGITHKIVSSKRIKIQGISKTISVNGLSQFINIPNIEYTNARILNTPKGYYVQFICFIPQENKKIDNNKVLGIDFGCSTSFTTSEGEKISIQVQESERLKNLSARLNRRQKKGSKNWYRTVKQIQREYQKQTNQKNDKANKIIAHFNEYKTIVIQDEQISKWQKSGHGKAVQHSVLGRVKTKLLTNPKVVILSKTVPTTKLCTKCGVYHDELKLSDRTFRCDCGVEMDRDIHAAKNMVWFYENNVGVGHTNFKRVEMKALVSQALNLAEQPLV